MTSHAASAIPTQKANHMRLGTTPLLHPHPLLHASPPKPHPLSIPKTPSFSSQLPLSPVSPPPHNMDFEPQHQQLLIQHQDYQQQQQQPQQLAQPYDPSLAQPQAYDYDPSTQAYYPGYPQTYQNNSSLPQHQYQQQQQPYPYYPPDYGSAGTTVPAAASYQQPAQADPNNGQSSAINLPPEAPQILANSAVAQPQQNAYYPQDQQPSYDVPDGLNPAAAAAVAALSQLTQFAGKMDAAERAMAGMQDRQWPANNEAFGQMAGHHPFQHGYGHFRPPVGRPPFRGGVGGRRGGGRFRGGRSNFGDRRPRQDGGAPPFRGRGRMGRGGGRRFQQPAHVAPSSPHSESALEPASAPLPVPAPERKRRPPQVAWCDLCRVDCNTQEVLDQHKNGKRHKKNMEKLEQFQKYEKIKSASQPKLAEPLENGQVGEEIKVSVPENLPDASAPENLPQASAPGNLPQASAPENLPKASSSENLPSAAAADEKKMEMVQQTQTGEQSEIPKAEEPTEAPAKKPWAGSYEDRRRGFKRKPMKFGRGGKRLRYSEVVSTSETPREEPKYCSLCNVTCDTQAVLECHLAGKKHMSRVNRTPGQHGNYGPIGHHALYTAHAQPRSFIPQAHNVPPIHDEGQNAAYRQPVVDYGDGQTQQAVTGPQAQQDSGLQGPSSTPEPKLPEAVVETKAQDAVMVETEGKVTALENASTGAKPDLLVMKDVSAPDYGVPSTDHAVISGPG